MDKTLYRFYLDHFGKTTVHATRNCEVIYKQIKVCKEKKKFYRIAENRRKVYSLERISFFRYKQIANYRMKQDGDPYLRLNEVTCRPASPEKYFASPKNCGK